MYQLFLEGHFSAAHSLREYDGECEKLHGHNWKVEAVLEANELDRIGMVIDFKDAKKFLKDCLKDLDHEFINEVGNFKEINPTTENIARFIFKSLQAKLPENVRVKKVISWETPGNGAAYIE